MEQSEPNIDQRWFCSDKIENIKYRTMLSASPGEVEPYFIQDPNQGKTIPPFYRKKIQFFYIHVFIFFPFPTQQMVTENCPTSSLCAELGNIPKNCPCVSAADKRSHLEELLTAGTPNPELAAPKKGKKLILGPGLGYK